MNDWPLGRIYVAGPWLEREKAPHVAKLFEDAGYVITHKWWLYEGEDENKESADFRRQCAESDLEGVLTADAVVVINTIKSEGKAVEQGIAIAQGIPVILIGKNRNNIFYDLPEIVKVDTAEEALDFVNRFINTEVYSD